MKQWMLYQKLSQGSPRFLIIQPAFDWNVGQQKANPRKRSIKSGNTTKSTQIQFLAVCSAAEQRMESEVTFQFFVCCGDLENEKGR
jgi:hypothetical protein